MRTVLSGIHLFNNMDKIIGQHFISNGSRGEESKIVERQRMCVRQCVVVRER